MRAVASRGNGVPPWQLRRWCAGGRCSLAAINHALAWLLIRGDLARLGQLGIKRRQTLATFKSCLKRTWLTSPAGALPGSGTMPGEVTPAMWLHTLGPGCVGLRETAGTSMEPPGVAPSRASPV